MIWSRFELKWLSVALQGVLLNLYSTTGSSVIAAVVVVVGIVVLLVLPILGTSFQLGLPRWVL